MTHLILSTLSLHSLVRVCLKTQVQESALVDETVSTQQTNLYPHFIPSHSFETGSPLHKNIVFSSSCGCSAQLLLLLLSLQLLPPPSSLSTTSKCWSVREQYIFCLKWQRLSLICCCVVLRTEVLFRTLQDQGQQAPQPPSDCTRGSEIDHQADHAPE